MRVHRRFALKAMPSALVGAGGTRNGTASGARSPARPGGRSVQIRRQQAQALQPPPGSVGSPGPVPAVLPGPAGSRGMAAARRPGAGGPLTPQLRSRSSPGPIDRPVAPPRSMATTRRAVAGNPGNRRTTSTPVGAGVARRPAAQASDGDLRSCSRQWRRPYAPVRSDPAAPDTTAQSHPGFPYSPVPVLLLGVPQGPDIGAPRPEGDGDCRRRPVASPRAGGYEDADGPASG
jgi:hypothetical protein